MSIHLVLGPMFAGKTSELLRLGRRHELAGKKVCYVKHELDCMRTQGANLISTHDGQQAHQPCLVSNHLMDLLGTMLEAEIICIDEGQFFDDLRPVVNLLLVNSNQKHVIISALNGTYRQQLFPSIASLLPLAETVEWLTAVCFRCGSLHATFTRCLNDKWDGTNVSLPAEDLIGGGDKYEALCRSCFYAHNPAKKEKEDEMEPTD